MTTWVSRYQKGRTMLDFNETRLRGGSGSSWTIHKSFTFSSRRITTPAHIITQFLWARCSSFHPTNSVTALKPDNHTNYYLFRVNCTSFNNIYAVYFLRYESLKTINSRVLLPVRCTIALHSLHRTSCIIWHRHLRTGVDLIVSKFYCQQSLADRN